MVPDERRRGTSADATPLPAAQVSGVDARTLDVWCTWLGELATNAEAALAAAHAYKVLDAGARDRWIAALEHDAARVPVPRIAIYAPLLSVESDPDRRRAILTAMGPAEPSVEPRFEPRGLRGRQVDGTSVATLVRPLYLDFAQVLACGYDEYGFRWVKHDPIMAVASTPRVGDSVSGATLESVPLKALIDELAPVVLAHVRRGREIPEALRVFADLFSASAEPAPAV